MMHARHLLEEMIAAQGVGPAHHGRASRRSSASTARSRRRAYEVLTPEMTPQLAYSVLTDEQRKRFETTKELDFSFGVKGLSRFRAQRLPAARRGRRWRSARSPTRSCRSRSSACRRSVQRRSPNRHEGAGAGHRADRQRQVDDARGDDRPDQRRAAPATSSRSRTRSSTSTTTRSASSTSAR